MPDRGRDIFWSGRLFAQSCDFQLGPASNPLAGLFFRLQSEKESCPSGGRAVPARAEQLDGFRL
jgi:hypothetical protein